MSAKLNDILDDTPQTLDDVMGEGADLTPEFDFDNHISQMDAAITHATHGNDVLGATDANGTLLQFGKTTGLGATDTTGGLLQSSGGLTPVLPAPTVYPILQGPGPRRDLRFDSFASAKSLLAPKQPGIYAPASTPQPPKATPATLPQAFPQFPSSR